MRPTLTVLMANYNEGEYLRDRLASILSQSWPADEIHIVDDGSEDDSMEILTEFASRHPSLKVHPNVVNRGLNYTGKKLMAMPMGDYMVSASCDDIMLPGFFEENMKLLVAHPQAALSFSLCKFLPEGSDQILYNKIDWPLGPCYLTPEEIVTRMYRFPMGGTAVVMRMEAIREAGIHYELKWHWDAINELVASLRHGMCFIPEAFNIVRVRRTSYSQAGMRDWSQEGKILNHLLRLLKSPEYADILPLFQRGGYYSWYHDRGLRAVLSNPEHWDLDSMQLIRPILGDYLGDDAKIESCILGPLRESLGGLAMA